MKKIIIFTSHGGGGQSSVTNALISYFGNAYTIQSSYIFSDVINAIDPLHVITRGKISGEDLYNYFLAKKFHRLVNFMAYILATRYYKFWNTKIERQLRNFLLHEKPDLVVSVIPLVNGEILAVTQQLNLPFLLLPPDLDTNFYTYGITKAPPSKFYVGIPFEEATIIEQLKKIKIPRENIKITGYPIRPDFLIPKDTAAIKKDFNIPGNKPIILLMLGSIGSPSLCNYTQQLIRITEPAHLIICLGKSSNLQEKIETIAYPPHITTSVIPFTSRIADLLALADIVITKSGTVSLAEALYLNKPMILDATSTILAWEQFNHPFINNHGFGLSVDHYEKVHELVSNLLHNKTELAAFQTAITAYPKKNSHQELANIFGELFI